MKAFTVLLFFAIVGLALAIDVPKNKTLVQPGQQTHPAPPPPPPTGSRDARFVGLYGGYGLGYGGVFPYYGGYIGGYGYPYGYYYG